MNKKNNINNISINNTNNTNDNTAVLNVNNLCIKLEGTSKNKKPLLSDLSFSVAKGKITAIVGQSGSGKSLTSLSIIGLLPPSLIASGSILLNGKEIIKESEKNMIKRRGSEAAIVFQDPSSSLDPLMKIGKQMSLPLKKYTGYTGSSLREAVFTSLQEVKLPDIERIAKSYPHQISGGQRQRVAIALALACSPQLLIADEPTSALDASVQDAIVDLIIDCSKKRNIAVVFITHDLSIINKIADNVIVLKDGVIIESGTKTDIMQRPQTDYTKLLLECSKMLEKGNKKE
ncbi:MAG: hypothetical protein Ta2B_08430 [Termitinemataceae bacterium]|nr:MAG: hypothetical protein Ta2B_08430 [Termitinemataceae bacterium]